VDFSRAFKNVPAVIDPEALELRDKLCGIVLLTVPSHVAKRPARPIELPTNRQDPSKPETVLSRPPNPLHAEGLNPNRIESNLAAEIELSAAQLVERLNLERLIDGPGERSFRRARHPRDRVRHAYDAYPVPDLNVESCDVS
jgi:hypothetical protein